MKTVRKKKSFYNFWKERTCVCEQPKESETWKCKMFFYKKNTNYLSLKVKPRTVHHKNFLTELYISFLWFLVIGVPAQQYFLCLHRGVPAECASCLLFWLLTQVCQVKGCGSVRGKLCSVLYYQVFSYRNNTVISIEISNISSKSVFWENIKTIV